MAMVTALKQKGGSRFFSIVTRGAVLLAYTCSLFIVRPENYARSLDTTSAGFSSTLVNAAESSASQESNRAEEIITRPGATTTSQIDVSSPLKYSDVFNPALENVDKFCVPWTLNMDSWWTHHPEWNVVSESNETLCFAKEVSSRTRLLKQMYENQFRTGNCSHVHTKHM